MILIIASLLLMASTYLILHQFEFLNQPSLPSNLKDNSGPDLLLRKDAFAGSTSKSWLPISNKFKTYEQRIPASGLRKRLIKAGAPVGVLEFYLFKLLALILFPTLGFIFLGNMFSKEIILCASLAMGFLLPEFWLNGRIKKRQAKIRKDLPNVIDLLSLCVSKGLDFMLAVNKVVKELKPCELTLELAEVYRQTQMGKTRREALKDFSWRVDLPEAHSFVRTLVQADRMGTPMGEALKLQSEEMRVRRFQNGEAMALKAPIKLLLPLFVFILPVVLIIVGAPIILDFMSNKGGLGF